MRCYFVKNWKRIALPLFLTILYSGIFTLWQLGLMRLFDAAARLDLDAFLTWTVIELAGITLYYGVLILENIAEARTVRALNNQVRHDLYLSLMEKSHSAYHSQDTGEYISWLTSNVKQIERLAWSPFFSFASCITVVLFNIAALASLHWVILLAGLASTAGMLILPKLFQKRMERLGEVCAAAEEQGAAKLKDILSGFDVLRSFGRADRFLRQGDAVSRQIEDANCRRTCMQTSSAFLVGLTGNILMLLQMVIAVFLALQGKVILGAIVGAGNLTGGITNGLQNLASCRMSLASAKPYFDKITVHAGEQSAREAEGLSPVREAIAVENISFCYGEKPVLSALSATFEKGGKYALTGPSGCGKSTLLKLLLGWLPGYEGTIFFDGQDAKSYTPEQLQTQMSYIEQDVFLFNTTIRENITLGEDFTEEQIQKALQDSALAGDLAHMPLGLDTPVGEEGSALSGGQKQRVAIARALIHDRSILLVDEGTSALDQKNADIVEKSLLSNPDLTLILVSHHLTEERQKQFDRVYRL